MLNLGELIEPAFDLGGDLDVVPERNDLALDGVHRHDELVGLVEVDVVDAGEQLLQVRLNDGRLGGLAQDLEKVVVADEVEPRKAGPFLL